MILTFYLIIMIFPVFLKFNFTLFCLYWQKYGWDLWKRCVLSCIGECEVFPSYLESLHHYLTARWGCGSMVCSPGWAGEPEGCSWCPREACWEFGWRERPGGAGSALWGESQARTGASLTRYLPTEVKNRFKFGHWTVTSGFHRYT